MKFRAELPRTLVWFRSRLQRCQQGQICIARHRMADLWTDTAPLWGSSWETTLSAEEAGWQPGLDRWCRISQHPAQRPSRGLLVSGSPRLPGHALPAASMCTLSPSHHPQPAVQTLRGKEAWDSSCRSPLLARHLFPGWASSP